MSRRWRRHRAAGAGTEAAIGGIGAAAAIVGAARCAGAGGGVLDLRQGALGIDGSGSAADEPPSAGSVAGRLEAGILVPPSSMVKGIDAQI